MMLRIDDKLIHAQTIWGWVRALNLSQIIVANDEVAHDELRRHLLTSAVPEELSVRILSLEEAIAELKNDRSNTCENSIIIVSKPADAVTLIEKGTPVKHVSVGWMSFSPGKKQVLETVYMGEEDIQAFRKLIDMGVSLKYQATPSSAQLDAVFWIPDSKC